MKTYEGVEVWVAGALSLGVKWPGPEADHSPPPSAEVKECVKLYLHSPIRLHGVVLSFKKHRDKLTFAVLKLGKGKVKVIPVL
jgi:hypothetical protein